jgi:hypothetical protein
MLDISFVQEILFWLVFSPHRVRWIAVRFCHSGSPGLLGDSPGRESFFKEGFSMRVFAESRYDPASGNDK